MHGSRAHRGRGDSVKIRSALCCSTDNQWEMNVKRDFSTTVHACAWGSLPTLCALFVLLSLPSLGFSMWSQVAPIVKPAPVIDDPDVHDQSSIADATELHPAMPALLPEQALQAFQDRVRRQLWSLQGHTDDTLVTAEVPEASQRAAFELQRTFVAPRSLKYRAINFTGNTFLKSNVILRVLQSEVDFVEKGHRSETALTEANYKFSYKGEQRLDEHEVYVYQAKPRHKKVGLFKGHIYLDAHNGNPMRSEGVMVKSSSLFVRKIEFVQDWVEINRYIFPAHLHTNARVRILGHVVLDVYHRDYRNITIAELPISGRCLPPRVGPVQAYGLPPTVSQPDGNLLSGHTTLSARHKHFA
jgi:hypothetical protein